MPSRGWSGAVRYGLPGVFLGVALMGGFGGGRDLVAQAPSAPIGERPRAMPSPVGGDAAGTIAFTTAGGGSSQLLYLIDPKAHAFAIYRIDPSNSKGVVKLEATRQYQWDLKLTHYNNLEPEPPAIEQTVRALGQSNPSR
jgi:hypothetical protein